MDPVVIVDYGICNVDSVRRAVEECGGDPLVTERPDEVREAGCLILPGVGAFPDAMRRIRERGLDAALRDAALERGIPLLGICLGMQLLADRGFEFRETPGLGLVPGEVRRLEPAGEDTRIPHIGWNEVHATGQCPLLRDVPPGEDFYFVHSYHFLPADPAHAAARTPYAAGFVSVVQRDRIFGVQFHPEKSQKRGFQVLRSFLALEPGPR